MAQQQKKVSVGQPGSARGGRETYRYAASSFRTKSNEGRVIVWPCMDIGQS